MIAALFCVTSVPAFAQLSDVKGSKDHPMVSRYAGSVIIGYDARKFDEFDIPLGPLTAAWRTRGKTPSRLPRRSAWKGKRHADSLRRSGGSITAQNRAELRAQLKKNGFETPSIRAARRSAAKQDGWLATFYLYTLKKQLSQTPPPGIGRQVGQVSEYALATPVNQRYLAMKRERPEGDVYVSVYVATNRFTVHKETQDHPVILLDVIDAVPIETGMVTVDAAAMAKDISATGHVALYGIYFDTDKADIKPESQPAPRGNHDAAEAGSVAEALSSSATQTTSARNDYNLGLSERRAAAVVKELTTKHGIAAARLKPAGVGMLSPVAPNDSEQGRAKNRRVELVKQ